MGEFAEPVRLDGAAGVHVRVDQRREPLGSFDDVVELEADLAQHVEVGAEAGGVHDDVGGVRDDLAVAVADELDRVAGAVARG